MNRSEASKGCIASANEVLFTFGVEAARGCTLSEAGAPSSEGPLYSKFTIKLLT